MSDYEEDDPGLVLFSLLCFFVFITIVYLLGK